MLKKLEICHNDSCKGQGMSSDDSIINTRNKTVSFNRKCSVFHLFQGAELNKLTCYFWFISVQSVFFLPFWRCVMMHILTYNDRGQCVHFASTLRNKVIQKDWQWRNRKNMSGNWKPKHSTCHIINIRKSLIQTYADSLLMIKQIGKIS